MAESEVSRVYAGALLEVAQERDILEEVEDELGFLYELIAEDRGLLLYLCNPGINKEAKKIFIDKVFSKNFSEEIVNFLKIIIDNDRQALVRDIYNSFIELIDELKNRKRVAVITRDKLGGEVLVNIKKVLKEKLNKEIILEEDIDESILGGIIIKIDDLVIDGSLARDLKNLRDNLLNSNVRSKASYED